MDCLDNSVPTHCQNQIQRDRGVYALFAKSRDGEKQDANDDDSRMIRANYKASHRLQALAHDFASTASALNDSTSLTLTFESARRNGRQSP